MILKYGIEVSDNSHNFIGVGDGNNMGNNVACAPPYLGVCYSSIINGLNNCIMDGVNHSAVIGGSGNIVQHNYAAVFGQGITTICDNYFHVNNMYVKNMPTACTGLVSGSLWYCTTDCIVRIIP